jgi:hypothetical protein
MTKFSIIISHQEEIISQGGMQQYHKNSWTRRRNEKNPWTRRNAKSS